MISKFFSVGFCAWASFCLLLGNFAVVKGENSVSSRQFNPSERRQMVTLLAKHPFDRSFLKTVFNDKRLQRIPVAVNRNLINTEYQDNYANFLKPYSLRRAQQFSRKWRSTLNRASRTFAVDSEVLVAILLVETGFGQVLGKYSIISVFSSIVLEHQQQVANNRRQTQKPGEQTDEELRLQQKASWAMGELLALLTIAQKTGISPFQFKGSYAGAFGIPQFLPSSYLKWGYDSDQNGNINLFMIPDAIYSAANYLKAHGWQKGLQQETNKQAIWAYNHSQVYVDTVYRVALRLQNPLPQPLPETETASPDQFADGSEKPRAPVQSKML